jgi:hypothetical protein
VWPRANLRGEAVAWLQNNRTAVVMVRRRAADPAPCRSHGNHFDLKMRRRPFPRSPGASPMGKPPASA